MTDTDLSLGAAFAPARHDEWVELAEKALKGRPVESLRTTTLDDIVIEPLYTRADAADLPDAGLPGLAPYIRGSRPGGAVLAGWEVRQHFALPDPAAQNDAILTGLEGGVGSVWVRVDDVDDLARMLEGVRFDLAPVALDAGHRTAAAAHRLVELWRAGAAPGAEIGGSLRDDPIGLLAATGRLRAPLEEHFDELRSLIELVDDFPQVRAVLVDGTPYADAGASDGEELALSLATAVAYLRALTHRGLSVDQAARRIEFTITVSVDQFAGMAKLRAARRLWARVVEVSGGDATSQRQVQHAVTSSAMLTRCDPWVNLLRVTIATFAAGLGGADSVTAAPFDAALGVPDEMGRRLARNTQALLLEESNLARVIDPAGGSWYVESLTDAIAQAAWARFRQIESAGGVVSQLRSGAVAAEIDATWDRRLHALGTRRQAITGVSEFPDLAEQPTERPARAPRPQPENPGDTVTPLPQRRLAEPFEALRDAARSAAPAPAVFCANLGPLSVHTARTSWATNFFAAGGIAALSDQRFTDGAAAAAAFAASGTPVAVICSSDEQYRQLGESTARALTAAGAQRVYLAGNPGEHREAYRRAGVHDFVHIGVDVLAILQEVHAVLGLGGAP